MIWAFDADAIIYAAEPGHPLGARVRWAMGRPGNELFGSVMLVPEVLIKQRLGDATASLEALLGRLHLVDASREVIDTATGLGATYGLRAVDAVHLATAVHVGADYFVTNNTRDFDPVAIAEVDVVSPARL